MTQDTDRPNEADMANKAERDAAYAAEMGPDNPPAFPRTGEGFGNPYYDTPGMSLRDWFAGQALAGIVTAQLGKGPTANEETFAYGAYAIADAMLTRRAEAPETA